MNMRTVTITVVVCFVALCGILIFDSGLFKNTGINTESPLISLAAKAESVEKSDLPETKIEPTDSPAPAKVGSLDFSGLNAPAATSRKVILGSLEPDRGYKFEIEFTSQGAAISKATLSEFDDRDPEKPVPLVILAPIEDKDTIYSLANSYLYCIPNQPDAKLKIRTIHWQTGDKKVNPEDGSQSVTFSTIIIDAVGNEIFRLVKTYTILKNSYDVYCKLDVENLLGEPIKARLDMQGPGGVIREATRRDMRSIVAGYILPDGSIDSVKRDNTKLRKAEKSNDADGMSLRSKKNGAKFVWAATTNKYFASILRPVPKGDNDAPDDVRLGPAEYYDPELEDKRPDGNEELGFSVVMDGIKLTAAGESGSSKSFQYELFIGPKDKDLFDENPTYDKYGYFHTITFIGCCCPNSIISPLAFGIMALMKWMYIAMGPLGNYGIVIMILVVLVRLLMHPITKKSQVSMMKMQKLGPKLEEIKKKYANDKAELNTQIMKFYKEQGVSPFSSILPMMIQMPIWISLWTAVYSSIDLRGAAFLPVWITDLSAPDALFRFSGFTIPLVGWYIDSFNLLPILLGVVMFLQQKLMPHNTPAQADSAIAQQQKMMMYMMPLMFPLMLYKGPSGVNLYIMSSMTASVIEQAVIRKHIREKEEAESVGLVSATSKTGGKARKKKPKPMFKHH